MKARTKRIIYTLLMPPALMALAVALSALARLLEQTAGGKALMLVALAAVAVKLGHMAWTWPGWTDDERKAEMTKG